MRRLPAAILLFLIAGAALASPLLLIFVWPAPAPGSAYAFARSLTLGARIVAAAIALSGAALFAIALRRREPWSARSLAVLAVACLLVAGALASPLVKDAVVGGIASRYTQGGFLEPYPEVSLGASPPPDDRTYAFTGSRSVENVSSTVDAGPVHARRGDVWDVAVRADGVGWQGEGAPTLATDVPTRCAPGPSVDDRTNVRSPLIIVWWHCVALGSGDGSVHVTLPGPAPGNVLVLVNVLPALDWSVTASLPRAEASVALGLALAAGVAWWVQRRREADPPR